MSVSSSKLTPIVPLIFAAVLFVFAGAEAATKTIRIPEKDAFVPMALSIRVGDSVKWVNEDEDDHTIVADDTLTTAGHKGLNQMLVGLEHNNDVPGTFTLKFMSPGRFVYFCRFHSHLNTDSQPIAPGPKGGEQDAKGNYGTPMMGVITVLPAAQQ